jgi:hypothetical protein
MSWQAIDRDGLTPQKAPALLPGIKVTRGCLRLFKRRRNGRECGVQLCAEGLHSCYDCQRDAGGDEADTRIGRRQTGLLAYDDPGEAAAYGVSIVVGQVTWNDADIPQ